MKIEDALERLSPESANNVPAGRLAWIEEIAEPTFESAPQGAAIGYGMGVAHDGALGLMLAVRDADNRLMAGTLLNPFEAMAAGRWLLQSAFEGVKRLAEYMDPDKAEEIAKLAGRELGLLYCEVYPEIQARIRREEYKRARDDLHVEGRMYREELRRTARSDIEHEYRGKILRLAKAAAELDDNRQTEMLASLLPWITKVVSEHTD